MLFNPQVKRYRSHELPSCGICAIRRSQASVRILEIELFTGRASGFSSPNPVATDVESQSVMDLIVKFATRSATEKVASELLLV